MTPGGINTSGIKIKKKAMLDYPTYEQVESFAEDFRTGAKDACVIGVRWARYWLDPTLNILTTLLKGNTYAVVAYPPAGWEYTYPGEVRYLEYFRGWILEYNPRTQFWTLLISSQEVGIEDFMLLRQACQEG